MGCHGFSRLIAASSGHLGLVNPFKHLVSLSVFLAHKATSPPATPLGVLLVSTK